MTYPIVLFGMTACGKTTIAKKLQQKGFKKIISFTTRPARSGERDGVDYHFISCERFLEMCQKGEFAETTARLSEHGKVYYGTAKVDYGNPEPSVVVLDISGVNFFQEHQIPHTSILIQSPLKEIQKRLKNRGDTEDEVNIRLECDKVIFKNAAKLADYIIDNQGDVDDVIALIKKLK